MIELCQWAWDNADAVWKKAVDLGTVLAGAAAAWAAWEAKKAREQTAAAMKAQAEDGKKLVEASMLSAAAAQSSADTHEKEFRLIHRPWVSVRSVEVPHDISGPFPSQFMFTLYNGGSLPATDIQATCCFSIEHTPHQICEGPMFASNMGPGLYTAFAISRDVPEAFFQEFLARRSLDLDIDVTYRDAIGDRNTMISQYRWNDRKKAFEGRATDYQHESL
jgi:hypothetical protein